MRVPLFIFVGLSSVFASPHRMLAQATNLDNVYKDESHCLVQPEIRSAADMPSSCFCRDALVQASYVWRAYLLTGKDRNLNGSYLILEMNAGEKCGDGFNVLSAVEAGSGWNGPEVTRTYPPDKTIEQLKPDKKGFRSVEYAVLLTFRDRQGHVTKIENFIARELLPPDFKKYSCPTSAVCPK